MTSSTALQEPLPSYSSMFNRLNDVLHPFGFQTGLNMHVALPVTSYFKLTGMQHIPNSPAAPRRPGPNGFNWAVGAIVHDEHEKHQIDTDPDSPIVDSHRIALAARTEAMPFSTKLSFQYRRRWGGLGDAARFARIRLFGMSKAVRDFQTRTAFPAVHGAAEAALATPSWHAEIKATANGMLYGSYMHHGDEGLARVEETVGTAVDSLSWAAKVCGLGVLHPAAWMPAVGKGLSAVGGVLGVTSGSGGDDDDVSTSSFDSLGSGAASGPGNSGSGSELWKGAFGVDALRVGGEVMVSDLSWFGRSKTAAKKGSLGYTQYPVRRRGPSAFPGVSYSAAVCADVSSWFEGRTPALDEDEDTLSGGAGGSGSGAVGKVGEVRAASPGSLSTYEPEEETSLAMLSEGSGRATHLLTASLEQIRMGTPTVKLMYRHALHGGQAALRSGEAGARRGDTPETLSQIEWDYTTSKPLVSAGMYLPFRETGSVIRGSVTSQGVIRGEVERRLVPGARAALVFDGGIWPSDKFRLQCRVRIGEGYEREQQEVMAVTPLLLKDGPTALWE